MCVQRQQQPYARDKVGEFRADLPPFLAGSVTATLAGAFAVGTDKEGALAASGTYMFDTRAGTWELMVGMSYTSRRGG